MAAWRLAALTSILCMAGFMRAEEPTLPQVKLQAPALPRSNASQSSAKSNSFAVPPLIMPGPFEAGGLPNAVEVSQPLQPVTNPPPSADAPREMFAWEELTAPFPYSWFSGEFLSWWPKPQPLPPLALSGRPNTMPRLGGPHTISLLGELNEESRRSHGARFTHGIRLCEDGTTAMSVSYLFLNGQVRRGQVMPDQLHANRSLARPVVNATTGYEDAIFISQANSVEGSFATATSTRLNGWEITSLWNIANGPQARVNMLAGYRYLQLNEGFFAAQQTKLLEGGSVVGRGLFVDEFQTSNQFHGGQVGLIADVTHGSLFLEFSGKVALGQITNTTRTSGSSILEDRFGLRTQPFGILVQPSNAGRQANNTFSVLPEAIIKLGYRFRSDSRLYVGYNFFYVSDVARPGDQIDRTLEVDQIPFASHPGLIVSERPHALFRRGDFWAQGLLLGVEWRY